MVWFTYRCENVESSDPCDSLPILIDLNKDCDISENAPLPDPSYFYNFVHDHAYISLKMFPFSNVHLSLDKVFSWTGQSICDLLFYVKLFYAFVFRFSWFPMSQFSLVT